MNVCMNVCMHAFIRMRVRVCMHARMHVYACAHACTLTCSPTIDAKCPMYACMPACVWIRTCSPTIDAKGACRKESRSTGAIVLTCPSVLRFSMEPLAIAPTSTWCRLRANCSHVSLDLEAKASISWACTSISDGLTVGASASMLRRERESRARVICEGESGA